jgi:hypothetical protein
MFRSTCDEFYRVTHSPKSHAAAVGSSIYKNSIIAYRIEQYNKIATRTRRTGSPKSHNAADGRSIHKNSIADNRIKQSNETVPTTRRTGTTDCDAIVTITIYRLFFCKRLFLDFIDTLRGGSFKLIKWAHRNRKPEQVHDE